MIKPQDVITAYIPFPDIDSELAVNSHMYICKEPGLDKEILKIQTLKPHHVFNMPCEEYEELDASDDDNPCVKDSFVDLDKTFNLFDVRIPKSKLAKRNIGDLTYAKIYKKLPTKKYETLDDYDFLDLNYECTRITNF